MKTERSWKRGTSFSMPITTTWTGGTLVTSLALPSLVTVAIVPVSATPKLAPVIPICAARNFSLRRLRAKEPRASTSGGSSLAGGLREDLDDPRRFMCRIGPTMCEGWSPASWAIHSPRSVSTISRSRSA